MAFMQVWTNGTPDAAVVTVEGEIDISNASLLTNAIADAYRTNRRVIVDVSRVAYLDGRAIRVLERAARENPGRFAVVVPSATVRRVFEVLGLIDTLPVVATMEAARERLRL